MIGRFATGHAFRQALEHRLRSQGHETNRPLDRLRKEVAHQRLLQRLLASAPPGSWTLKGGAALLARLSDRGRSTSDADANWRSSMADLEHALDRATATDLQDGFQFEIGRARPLTAETEDGGFRYPVRSLLASREFERIHLDVNLLPADQRECDQVQLRDLLGFAGITAPQVPAIPLSQQLAEKLHGYLRHYGGGSSRPRDLYDMLVIAECLQLPPAGQLIETCRQIFALRATEWPASVSKPPEEWHEAWNGFVHTYEVPWKSLDAAGEALGRFWDPLLGGAVAGATAWDPDRWRWLA